MHSLLRSCGAERLGPSALGFPRKAVRASECSSPMTFRSASRRPSVTGVPNHFISRRGGAIMPRSSPSFQQRQCEGAGTGTSQSRAPPPQPSQPGAGAKSGRNMASLGLGKLPEECLRFGRPSSFALSDGGPASMPHRLPRHTECVASRPVSRVRPTWYPARPGRHGRVANYLQPPPTGGHPPGATRTITFVVTRAPASRETRAAALSRAFPRRPNTPACAQAVRWWART